MGMRALDGCLTSKKISQLWEQKEKDEIARPRTQQASGKDCC